MALGQLDEKSAARQLLGAGVIDFCMLFLAARAIAPRVQQQLPVLRNDYGEAIVFVVLVALFWLLSDIILAGHTPGRLSFGLSMRLTNGRRPSIGRRFVRAITKLSTLGLTGLRIDRSAGYDRLAGIRWCSAMSPLLPGTAEHWRLRFASGPHAGKSIALTRIPGFTATAPDIRIGRDGAWANMPIEDPSISKRQCRLRAVGNRMEVMDGGDAQGGSTNGTYLGTRRLPVGKWVAWDSSLPLCIGKSTVHLDTL